MLQFIDLTLSSIVFELSFAGYYVGSNTTNKWNTYTELKVSVVSSPLGQLCHVPAVLSMCSADVLGVF